MDKKEYAIELKHNGHNCCQAVLCAFADETGLPHDTLKRIGAGFGLGMGCTEATCGALCAVAILLGLKKYEGRSVSAQAKEVHAKFKEMCKATLCKDLKGKDTGTVLCQCDDCVRNAVEITESKIFC